MMKREEFEHAIRAAGSIVGLNELLVIGSQAIHATVADDLPEAAQRSVEVDIAILGDTDGLHADLIDASIGEASMFHETFGYYAQGVVESTAVLPGGWAERLIRFETPATQGVAALCLEPHDLWISKAVANRPKDIDFCEALLQGGVVNRDVLMRRLDDMGNLDSQVAAMVRNRIGAHEGGH